MPAATPTSPASVVTVISQPRFDTYLRETSQDVGKALDLYAWNAETAAALLLPTHFAEVGARNAVADVLEMVYGPDWPWQQTFYDSLPQPPTGYKPRRDLVSVRSRHTTAGKVIAELKFVFWQKMFTRRHDNRLWTSHLATAFPHAPAQFSVAQLRTRIYDDLEAIRHLRNRMAHHEPIISRNLAADLGKMLDLIDMRDTTTATWVRSLEQASSVIAARP